MCDTCGFYNGRQIIDMQGRTTRKLERAKKKRIERGEDPSTVKEEEKTQALDPQELSKKS
jgi:hypothetical protein